MWTTAGFTDDEADGRNTDVFSSEIHPRKREFIEHNFASASSRGMLS